MPVLPSCSEFDKRWRRWRMILKHFSEDLSFQGAKGRQ
jgi:hypothetical protein